ncbi:MAG: C13 family peptidase [Massilia sp.]
MTGTTARAWLPDWIREGARTLFFCRPRWSRVRATPCMVALLVLLHVLVSIGVSRLYITGDATFYWRAIPAIGTHLSLTAWACYLLRSETTSNPARAPSPAYLLCLFLAQELCLALLWSPLSMALYSSGKMADAQPWLAWGIWLAAPILILFAQATVIRRSSDRKPLRRLIAIATVVFSYALAIFLAPQPAYWREKADPAAERVEPLRFTQDVVENQSPLLEEKVDALAPQRPGIADMYTITFAPYEGEEVFRRETRMVNEVMAKRFDATGRGLQLLNHREHLEDMVWATPTNLQRAIEGIAATMDKDEDVLFIHMTSHGASDGEMAVNFWPLEVDPVTPKDLRKWLDDAGIKHRVISISACYAGNWVAPLANDDTLVMTASDADHTSYGCGKRSPLTFFGRAMYDEQLRNSTLDFEAAHAASRKIIDQREKEAGKSDGYSNPQIKVGSRIRPYLEKMRVRLDGLKAH